MSDSSPAGAESSTSTRSTTANNRTTNISPTASIGTTTSNARTEKLNHLKRNLTLDLTHNRTVSAVAATSGSTNKGDLQVSTPDLQVSTPDLKMFVNTPELERMILANGTPSTPIMTPMTSTILFPKAVTKEQESFATGFMDALQGMHANHESNSLASDSGSTTFTEMDQPPNLSTFLPHIKEEPQTVPSSMSHSRSVSPVAPVDMEYQERMKLERKRQRNRLAASKCRSRKLERISKLEDKVKCLKGENTDLASAVNQLKATVSSLKLEVMQHMNAGCDISVNSL